MSAGVAPCAPTPGRSRIACGSSRRASPTARGWVAPTTAPMLESPHSPTISSPSSRTSSATCCQSGRPSESVRSWTSVLPAFEVLTRQKMPPPAAPAGGDEGLERVAAEVGVDGERVGERLPALARLEVGVGVGAGGRADVAALAVDDHEQAGVARVGDDALEGGEPVAAEHLEEGELRLDRDDVRSDRVDDAAAEARGCLGRRRPADVGVAAQLQREQVEPRVEADDELAALLLDRRRDPVGEGRWSTTASASVPIAYERTDRATGAHAERPLGWTRRRGLARPSRRGRPA